MAAALGSSERPVKTDSPSVTLTGLYRGECDLGCGYSTWGANGPECAAYLMAHDLSHHDGARL